MFCILFIAERAFNLSGAVEIYVLLSSETVISNVFAYSIKLKKGVIASFYWQSKDICYGNKIMLDLTEYDILRHAVKHGVPRDELRAPSLGGDYSTYIKNVNMIEHLGETAYVDNGSILETLLQQELGKLYMSADTRKTIKRNIDKALKYDADRLKELEDFIYFIDHKCSGARTFTKGPVKSTTTRIKITLDYDNITNLDSTFDSIVLTEECDAVYYNFKGDVIVKYLKNFTDIKCLPNEMILNYRNRHIRVRHTDALYIEFIETDSRDTVFVIQEIGKILKCEMTNYDVKVSHYRSFELYSINLNIDILKYVIVNDNILSKYFFMKECNNILRRRTVSIFSRTFPNISFSINITRPTVITVGIKNCSSVKQLDDVAETILHILHYTLLHSEHITQFLNRYLTKKISLSTVYSAPKNNTLRAMEPAMFISHYTRLCPNPPVVVDDKEAETLPPDMVMKFPMFGESETRNYTCKHEKYKYIGLKENTLGNKREYPFLPCCFFKSQMQKQSSAFNRYSGKTQCAAKRQSVDVSISMKILAPKKIGKLPQNIEEFLYAESSKRYARCGTFTDTDSLYEALCIATGRKSLQDIQSIVLQMKKHSLHGDSVANMENYLNINIFVFNYVSDVCSLAHNFKTMCYDRYVRPRAVFLLFHQTERQYELVLDHNAAMAVQKGNAVTCTEPFDSPIVSKLLAIEKSLNGSIPLPENPVVQSNNVFIDEFGFPRVADDSLIPHGSIVYNCKSNVYKSEDVGDLHRFMYLRKLSRCLFAMTVHFYRHLGVMDFWKNFTLVDPTIQYRIPKDSTYASHYDVFVKNNRLIFQSEELRDKLKYNLSIMSTKEKREFEKLHSHLYYNDIVDFNVNAGENISYHKRLLNITNQSHPNYCGLLHPSSVIVPDIVYSFDEDFFPEYKEKYVIFRRINIDSIDKSTPIILIHKTNDIKVYYNPDAKAVVYISDEKLFGEIYDTILSKPQTIENVEEDNEDSEIEDMEFDF